MRFFRVIALWGVLGLGLAGAGCATRAARAPARQPDRLTAEEAVALGRALGPWVERMLGGRTTRLAVEAYIAAVGQRLAWVTPLASTPCRFGVLEVDRRRAVALPGGVVYVTRGLLADLDSEAQLAAVLARELAHLSAGHVEAVLRARFDLATLRRAAEALEAGPDSGAAKAAERVARALLENDYSPEAHREADRLALDYLVAAGYNPTGLLEVLRRGGAGGERLEAARRTLDRKYGEAGGRVADEVYKREVLERLGPP